MKISTFLFHKKFIYLWYKYESYISLSLMNIDAFRLSKIHNICHSISALSISCKKNWNQINWECKQCFSDLHIISTIIKDLLWLFEINCKEMMIKFCLDDRQGMQTSLFWDPNLCIYYIYVQTFLGLLFVVHKRLFVTYKISLIPLWNAISMPLWLNPIIFSCHIWSTYNILDEKTRLHTTSFEIFNDLQYLNSY